MWDRLDVFLAGVFARRMAAMACVTSCCGVEAVFGDAQVMDVVVVLFPLRVFSGECSPGLGRVAVCCRCLSCCRLASANQIAVGTDRGAMMGCGGAMCCRQGLRGTPVREA